MAPSKNWDDEDSDSSEGSSPPVITRRGKFDDEEDDGDVLDSWDAAEDSEVEREKAKKAEELRLQKEAEAKANKKTKAERIEEHKAQRKALEDDSDDDDMTPAERAAYVKERQEATERELASDMLFGDIGVSNNRSAVKPVVVTQSSDPTSAVDLSALPLFNPRTKDQFTKLKDTLVPLIERNNKNTHLYVTFLQEFTRAVANELSADDIGKITRGLTTLSNTKLAEKASQKGGKKTKAAKTKASLVATRNVSTKADVATYDDDFGDDDFM